MSTVTKSNLPCPSNICNSSDAYVEYDDGHGYCFSCGHLEKSLDKAKDKGYNISKNNKKEAPSLMTKQLAPIRGVSTKTLAKFNSYISVLEDGGSNALVTPYDSSSGLIRNIDNKEFISYGTPNKAPLFGMDIFDPGSSKVLTIVEGSLDAMSVFEMMGNYPVISVRGAASAYNDCKRHRKYIDSFSSIRLCLDNDDPGQKYIGDIVKLFGVSKVRIVNMTKYKDPNEYLMKGKTKEFIRVWWAAKKFMPKGIISDYSEIESILGKKQKPNVGAFPFPTLNDMTFGLRTGELVLVTAQEGIGKSEIIRAIEYEQLKNTDVNIGTIHLEEPEKRVIEGFAGYELKIPCHLPDSNCSTEEKLEAFKKATKKEGRLHIYSHFGSDDPGVILGIIRYLATSCECKIIFLDHITMVVTGREDMDERRVLDVLSTQLAMMTLELDFCLVLVSHVNDEGQTRGSRNISKVANTVIHLDRDNLNENEDMRNITKVMVKKNRYSGRTGPAGLLKFDPQTFTISELQEQEMDTPF